MPSSAGTPSRLSSHPVDDFDPRTRELIDGVRRREPAALAELFDLHAGRLLAACIPVLRDRAAAEEVLNDVLFEFWKRPERFDPDRGKLVAFLVVMARSRAIDRLRSRRARERHIGSIPDNAPEPRDEAQADPLESVHQRRQVRHALGRLGDDQRVAIRLSFIDGLTHTEIAHVLDEPLGTIKSRIRNGLGHMRRTLEAPFQDGAAV